ncbi:MAG: Pycsar system effector family protein [Acidimicrobiales bacterium]
MSSPASQGDNLRTLTLDDHEPGGFEGVTARGSVSYMFRNTQQQLVALSGQADLKASILITASSVVLTVGITQASDSRFTAAFATLAVFLLFALIGAILSVLPSFLPWDRSKPLPGAEPLPNLLFFGDFTKMPESEFIHELGRLSQADASLYEAQARDLYRQGSYLLAHKYRFLRVGYVMFLLGFMASTLVVLATLFV